MLHISEGERLENDMKKKIVAVKHQNLWRRERQPTPVFLPGVPWTEEPGGPQSMGRSVHDLVTKPVRLLRQFHCW